MWGWIGRSLRRKLSIIMLASSLVPLLFLGGFAFVISSKITEDSTNRAGIDTLRQMEGSLRFMLQDIQNMSIFLIGQQDIQRFMVRPDEDMAERTRISGMLANLSSSKNYIADISIVPANGISAISSTTVYESSLAAQVDLRTVTDKMWTGLYRMTTYAGEIHALSFIRPLRSTDNYTQTLGWIVISLDEKMISRLWSNPNAGFQQGKVALLSEGGVILSSTEKIWLNRPFPTLFSADWPLSSAEYGVTTQGEGRMKNSILYYREPLTGWTLVDVVPYEQYRVQNRYILQLTVAAVGLSVVVTAGLILFLIRRVTNPLAVLARLLGKVNPDEPLPHYTANSSDEIGRLTESYNKLGDHIENLKTQLIRNEALKKEADMRALQAQINPHFLYNTLSSIHWIALMSEEKKIADMVGALSDFLRFSLNKGKEFCPVHQEIAHIKNYAQVQSIRFPDQFDVDFAVDPELQDKLMLKLLLQPLVENAMIHGVQKKEGKGTIAIYVQKKDGQMSFLVMDNGIGMTGEQLQAIRASLNPREGEELTESVSYGLRNVHQRLTLHYGPEAGLHIESRPNAGTRVSFSIPFLEVSDENHDRG
ncbi:sensor histidine kinase [Paenibacillus hamazuiensis]|uniref:sensor histidine kinase n=1 Tax=Paenibacillus hamazuiensis TaxID=2936508 RepID=UPI00200DB00A|nr:sensor histidine kinase [Paenibacillus hamazuiensis]